MYVIDMSNLCTNLLPDISVSMIHDTDRDNTQHIITPMNSSISLKLNKLIIVVIK